MLVLTCSNKNKPLNLSLKKKIFLSFFFITTCYVKHTLTPFLSLIPPCAHPVTDSHTCAQAVDQAVVMEGMLMCRLVQAAESCFSGKPACSLSHICAICWEILLSFLILETCLPGYIFWQKIQRNSNLLSIFSALNIGLGPFICWSRGMESLLRPPPLCMYPVTLSSICIISATHIAVTIFIIC